MPGQVVAGNAMSDRLASIRTDAGKTQAELAAAIGMTPRFIQRVEAAMEAPSISRVSRWLDACGSTYTVAGIVGLLPEVAEL
jgi:transcriptional regulator with XRE-family HTH domain